MDLFDVVRSCIRRWYVVLPLLLVVAWFSHDKYSHVKPVYYSQAVIAIAPPNTRVDQAAAGLSIPRNGLLDVGGAPFVASLTSLGLQEPSVVARVVAAGGSADYETKMYPAHEGRPELPLVLIETTQPDPIAATKTLEAVLAQADPTLRTLQQQAGVPDDQMAKSFVVSQPAEPVPGMPSRARSTIAIFVAGAGIAILAGVVIDVLLMRWKPHRQKRRQARVQTVDGPGSVDGVDTADEARKVHRQNRHTADEVAVDRR